jgi:transposase InsO family protein
MVERLWRSLKYEQVYLYAYESVAEACMKIGRYFDFYNTQGPHSSLFRPHKLSLKLRKLYFRLLNVVQEVRERKALRLRVRCL